MKGHRLSAHLRAGTRELHRAAERSGIMPRLLAGTIERGLYASLLCNLYALYATLEAALDRHAASPLVSPVRFPTLFRAAALRSDLDHLCGPGWTARPLSDSMRAYVARIEALADGQPGLLAAHAYVRYLGDLSGGQILRGIVAGALGLHDGVGVAFYSFGDESPDAAKARFRAGLDALPVDADAVASIVAEALDAFARHIRLFEELDRLPQGER
jgi:heme oxygenase